MKKLLLLVGLALLGTASWYIWETRKTPKNELPQQRPAAASRYSPDFITSIDSTLNNYYVLSESLVRWDSAHVDGNAEELKKKVKDIKFDELKKDTLVHHAAVSYSQKLLVGLDTLVKKKDLLAKRQVFNHFSQNLYDLLRSLHYDGGKVYLQQCPMAFYDTVPGVWLSRTAPIRNPYLGLHHPKYKGAMLDCGETKDSLDFITLSH